MSWTSTSCDPDLIESLFFGRRIIWQPGARQMVSSLADWTAETDFKLTKSELAAHPTPQPTAEFSIQSINIKMPVDLLHPSPEAEARTHKLKRLVQSPNSFFMDIKCPGCFQITTVFSHAQTVVLCGSCNVMLCQPTGGRARLTEGCSYRKKVD